MKRQSLLIAISFALCLVGVGSIVWTSNGEAFDAASSWSYGDVTFGASKNTDSTEASTSSFTTNNIQIKSLDNITKCYCPFSSGTYALRIGSSSSVGSLTFTFSSSYSITAIRVLAYQYDSSCSLTITDSSSYSVTQPVSATTGDDISNCLSSSWLSYTGFSGSISSLTFTGVSKRVNLCKFVVVLDGASSYDSSALSSSGYVSSSSSSSSSAQEGDSSSTSISSQSYSYANTSSSWSSLTNTSYAGNYIDATDGVSYRLSPLTGDGNNVSCYKVTSVSGTYYKTVVETLTKGGVYTDPNEVALYFNAFASFPSNYAHYTSSNLTSVKSSTYSSYGNKARLYTEYSKTTGCYDVTIVN